jgi:hypothetical protein
MATMKPKLSKTHKAKPVKAKEKKMIKPPVPSKPVKPKPSIARTNSKTGALGSTSPY